MIITLFWYNSSLLPVPTVTKCTMNELSTTSERDS